MGYKIIASNRLEANGISIDLIDIMLYPVNEIILIAVTKLPENPALWSVTDIAHE
jgi:hypothetical protein